MVESSLSVTTYNCKNVQSSWDEIKSLCKKCDILFLQETWLMEADLAILNQIDPNFYCKGLSSIDSQSQILVGRPYGGLAVLWKKSLGSCLNPVMLDDKRLLGAELVYDNVKILLISVYLPWARILIYKKYDHQKFVQIFAWTIYL